MASQSSKAGKQSKPAEAVQETPALPPEAEPIEATPVIEAAPVIDAVAAEAPSAQIAEPEAPAPSAAVAEIVSTSLAAVEATTEAFSASFHFDASDWSKKSFEIWTENASAFFTLAEKIVKAQTFEEVVDLQSRFAAERMEALLRQSKELMAFAQNVTALSAAPLCEVRKAA